MRTTLGRFSFEGPWDYSPGGLARIDNAPGVYVVLCRTDRGSRTLDLGWASDLRGELERHPRTGGWLEHCFHGILSVAVRSVESRREGLEILAELTVLLDPPCAPGPDSLA